MQIVKYPDRADWKGLLTRPAIDTHTLEATVTSILDNVKRNGDKALYQYTRDFDGVELAALQVSEAAVAAAANFVDDALKDAILQAKYNIEKFHASQKIVPKKIETSRGVLCWSKPVAIEKVGLYIPGGTAPLFSTVLMLGVPAQLAGCNDIVLCTPPSKEGGIHPAILFTASLLGIRSVFAVGGAQAIAAMAYGTATIPQVYKIFGPGNPYVTAAKQWVSKEGIAIDMPAGPSELAVVADHTAVPAFVAADLLSQAEHGADSQVMLVSTDEPLIHATIKEITEQVEQLPRKDIAKKALANSKAILLQSKEDTIAMINQYAPEHLILAVDNAEAFANTIRNAGSVFLGNFTPESAGDYASGTNHTLPTNGLARAYSGVSLSSFTKSITFQKINPLGLANLGPTIEKMAEAEQLEAHKNAVSLRLKHIKNEK